MFILFSLSVKKKGKNVCFLVENAIPLIIMIPTIIPFFFRYKREKILRLRCICVKFYFKYTYLMFINILLKYLKFQGGFNFCKSKIYYTLLFITFNIKSLNDRIFLLPHFKYDRAKKIKEKEIKLTTIV